jgi:hypothetical protein
MLILGSKRQWCPPDIIISCVGIDLADVEQQFDDGLMPMRGGPP